MKKTMVVIITLIMIFSLGGCGDSQSKDDNLNESDQNANTSDNDYKTYFEVVYNEGLLEAYEYFDENFENLSAEDKNDYLEELKKETLKRADLYKVFSDYQGVESQAPRTIENVDAFYPNVFDSSEYLFNINSLDEEIKIAANELKNDDIFALCKAYWNTEGYIEDIGFAAVLRKDVADIITNRFGDSKDEILNNLNSYTDQVSGMDNSFETEARNPVVLLENVDKFNLFEGLNKIVLYVPLKIVDEPVIENDSSDDEDSKDEDESSASDNENKDDETSENDSSDDETSENDSSDDETSTSVEEIPENIAIKNYDGYGANSLTAVNYDYKYSENFNDGRAKINKNLAVFGTIYDVEIGKIKLYTEGNMEILETYDEISDSMINLIDCPIDENNISEYMMYISFYDEDLNHYTFGFSSKKEEKELMYCGLNEQELKSDGPNNVGFNSGEDVIIGVIDGSDDDFTAIYLTDNYEEFVDDDVTLLYYPMDSRVKDNFEEVNYTVIIPLFVSSDMYDVNIEYSNYGEVLDNSSENKNIKAGTWVLFKGILQGDGEAYKIRFKLEDGTEKEIYMTTDESDEAVLINGYLINIR